LLVQLHKTQLQHEYDLRLKDEQAGELRSRLESLQLQLGVLQEQYNLAIKNHQEAEAAAAAAAAASAAAAAAAADGLASATRVAAEQRAKRKSDRAAYASVIQQFKDKFNAVMMERDSAFAAAAAAAAATCSSGGEGDGIALFGKVMELEAKVVQVKMLRATFTVCSC
jgi:predicted HNH restriction endonuclease